MRPCSTAAVLRARVYSDVATRRNIPPIAQGSNYNLTVRYRNEAGAVDLTGYKARMQFRETYESAAPSLSKDTDTDPTEIAIPTPVAGEIKITLQPTTTGALAARSYVFDIEIYDGSGVVIRIIEGRVPVTPEVTK